MFGLRGGCRRGRARRGRSVSRSERLGVVRRGRCGGCLMTGVVIDFSNEQGGCAGITEGCE